MTTRVTWLMVGHIAHGYRRVFVVHENQKLRHVVNVTPMPYEAVFRIRELASKEEVADPSLWWGLSVVLNLVKDGTLCAESNPDIADDGYLQVRPQVLPKEELLPLSTYQSAVKDGWLTLS